MKRSWSRKKKHIQKQNKIELIYHFANGQKLFSTKQQNIIIYRNQLFIVFFCFGTLCVNALHLSYIFCFFFSAYFLCYFICVPFIKHYFTLSLFRYRFNESKLLLLMWKTTTKSFWIDFAWRLFMSLKTRNREYIEINEKNWNSFNRIRLSLLLQFKREAFIMWAQVDNWSIDSRSGKR